MVAYNNKRYYIDIVETKPSFGISIIETDCEVDFAPPLDYKEPEKPVQSNPSKKSRKTPPEGFFCLFVYYVCVSTSSVMFELFLPIHLSSQNNF